jgi:hypothetical protein
VVLTFARALGEFGAVLVVSGGIQGRTETATLYIFRALDERQYVGAYSVALVLGALSLTLVLGRAAAVAGTSTIAGMKTRPRAEMIQDDAIKCKLRRVPRRSQPGPRPCPMMYGMGYISRYARDGDSRLAAAAHRAGLRPRPCTRVAKGVIAIAHAIGLSALGGIALGGITPAG